MQYIMAIFFALSNSSHTPLHFYPPNFKFSLSLSQTKMKINKQKLIRQKILNQTKTSNAEKQTNKKPWRPLCVGQLFLGTELSLKCG